MSREVPRGTPTRTEDYVYPVRDRLLLLGGLAAAGLLAVLLVGLYFGGAGSALSPGPVSGPHAAFGTECVNCHAVGAAVSDVRCERCHDSGTTGRLTNSGHVLFGSRDADKAGRAEEVACITCHVEHRGREVRLHRVDDRECAACHEFGTLDGHPEFAAVAAALQTGVGLKFPHKRHLQPDATGGDCAACHVPTTDLAGFQPIRFDRHCIRCHTDAAGHLTSVAEVSNRVEPMILMPDETPLPPGANRPRLERVPPAFFQKYRISQVVHRDPWVLYNARRLRRGIDPRAEAAERAVLTSQRAWLVQVLRTPALQELSTDDLEGLERSLAGLVGELRAEVERPAGSSPEAVEAVYEGVRLLSEDLSTVDWETAGEIGLGEALEAARSLPAEVEQMYAALDSRQDAGATEEELAADLEARRRELVDLLDAVVARQPELSDRAYDLRSRLEDLGPESAGADVGTERLQEGLDRLDEALRVIGTVPDPGAKIGAAEIDTLRRFARQRVGGGLNPAEFEARRTELLRLLDAVERRAGEAMAVRVADLRQRVLAVRPGDTGDAQRRQRLSRYERMLERVRLERELAEAGQRTRPLALGSLRDQAALGDLLAEVDERLEGLREGPWMSPPANPDQRDARATAWGDLMGLCSKCHELEGSWLAPVDITGPVMERSVFNHAPHVTQATCEECHGVPADPAGETSADPADSSTREASGVWASTSSSDLNVPGVESCRTCHQPSQVSTDCETCHRYHPPSLSTLLGTR